MPNWVTILVLAIQSFLLLGVGNAAARFSAGGDRR
jgi:hypothetical protein